MPGAGDGEALIRRGLGSSVLGGGGSGWGEAGEEDRSVTLARQDRGGRGNPGEGAEDAWDTQGKGRAPPLAPGSQCAGMKDRRRHPLPSRTPSPARTRRSLREASPAGQEPRGHSANTCCTHL